MLFLLFFLSSHAFATPPTFHFKDAPKRLSHDDSACGNFWKWACESQGQKLAIQASLDKAKQLVDSEYDKQTEKLNLWSNFKALIKLNGDPLLDFDEKKTLENYAQFYREKGARALYEHVLKYGSLHPIWVSHGGPFPKLYGPFLKKYDEGHLRGGRQAIMDWETKYGGPGFTHEGVEVLPDKPILAFQTLVTQNFESKSPDLFYQMIVEWLQGSFASQREDIREYLETGEFVQTSLRNSLYPPSRQKEIQALYQKVQEIGNKLLPENGRRQMTPVPLAFLPNEVREGFLSGAPWFHELATSDNAAYQPKAKKIVILGGHTFKTDSEILVTLAHEYSHAIDAHLQGDQRKWIDDVKSCLKTKEAANVGSHQTDEAFADWNAARIYANFLETHFPPLALDHKRKLALAMTSCQDYTPLSTDEHPSWDTRANRIFLSHPYFRKLFGCATQSGAKYCE